jgi:hypothetical protein
VDPRCDTIWNQFTPLVHSFSRKNARSMLHQIWAATLRRWSSRNRLINLCIKQHQSTPYQRNSLTSSRKPTRISLLIEMFFKRYGW